MIEVDGQQVVCQKKFFDDGSNHPLEIDGVYCTVRIMETGSGFDYAMEIPSGTPFEEAKQQWLMGANLVDGRYNQYWS